jgi:hypothetical protein
MEYELMKSLVALLALIPAVALAGTVPLAINQQKAFQVLGHWCGSINIYEYASGFNASGLPTADAYLYTQCSSGGRGGHAVIFSQWVSVTWDLGGNLVSVVDEPVPNPNPFQSTPTTTFTSGSYSEHTQTKTFQLVPGDPYVYSTGVLVTP